MGGKHKQAQRTKNNARPSSSCRSAELLGTSIPQFVGFSAIKESTVMSGFALTADDIDSSIDPNFQLVLKKMSKKDATTKSKALQEFTELVKTSDIEVVKAVLPFWPRLYCALATDTEHKVREATHVAHHQVVLKSKRNLAPYLKQFAGPWFTSQYDTYAPAATAATKSFQDAFPKNKIKEAILYCQEEILLYICENLTIHTAETLSNPKITSPEDAEAKYQRVLISSLHGYALYLQQLCTKEIENQEELNIKIISDNKFWKFVKHKVLSIKSAWFCVITSLCQKSPNFLTKEFARIVGSVFSHLDESEPTVVQSLWEAILSVLSTIKEWWQYVNIDKAVYPKLWKLLKEGGFGNACVIFPNLLPLISHLPPNTDPNSTFCLFFEHMFKGMKHQSSTRSRYESLAISTAYMECLQYIIMKNHFDIGFCEKLIRSYLFPVLEWSLTDAQASYKGLFNQISKIIQYWSKNSSNVNFPHYVKYSQYFWNNLNSLFQGLLLNLEIAYDKEMLSQFSSRQIELLLSLKHIVANKQLKVSFGTEEVTENVNNDNHNSSSLHMDQSYMESLHDVVYKTCVSYVKFINEKHSKELVECLGSLVQDFDSEYFFKRLNAEVEGENVNENITNIYWKLLNKWLNNKTICSNSVITLVFLLFKYLNYEDKVEVLNSFILLQDTECFGWCISQSLSHPYNEDSTIQTWLHNDAVSKFLTSIMEKELYDTSTPELQLILKKAFMEKHNGDLYLSANAVSSIVQVLNKCLLHHEKYTITVDTCVSFAAHVSTILYSTNYKLQFGDELLLAMFNLCCSSTVDPDIISVDTIWELNTAWQDAITVLSQELSWDEFKKLCSKCAGIVTNAVFSDTHDYNINHMIKIIVSFIKCMNCSPLRICDVLNLFLLREFIHPWKDTLVNACICAEYMLGHLCTPYESISFEYDLNETIINKYFIWMDLVAHVLTTPTMDEVENDDDTDVTINTVQTIFNLVYSSDIQELLVNLLESLTVSMIFVEHYSCTKHSEIVLTRKNSMQQKLKSIFSIMDEQSLTKIENSIKENIVKNNGLSVKLFYLYCSEIVSKSLSEEFTNLFKQYDNQNMKLICLHLTQAFSKCVNYQQVYNCPNDTESIIYLRTLMHLEDLEIPIAETFKKITNISQETKSYFLFESNIVNSITWSQVELIIECMRLFSTMLKYKSNISSNQWDFIIITFVTWTNNIANFKYKFRSLQMKTLIGALSELFVSVSEYIKSCDKESVKNEWNEVFAQDVNKDFVEMWLYISASYEDKSNELPIVDLPFLQTFGTIVDHLDYKVLFNNPNQKLPKWSKLVTQSCLLLTHSVYILQLWGYHMLQTLILGLVEVDLAAVTTNTPHEKGLIFKQFSVTVCSIQDVVGSLLVEFKLGDDSCKIEPYTDSYTYTSAYFLLWDILLSLCEYSSTELRYQYADWLRKENLLNNLLDNIYKLMPVEVMNHIEGKNKQLVDLFSSKFSVNLSGGCSSRHIEHMVCWCYFSALSQLPALVRQWWSQKEPRISQIVEKVTATFISPQLCSREFGEIIKNETKFKNMVIKVHPSVREVVAVYTVDEAQMELVITLKNNYPLTSPEVQCNRQISGTSHRQWLMQLKMCVLHQNGRIWDALSLWNNNLDKKFDGVEECYICFAVLHQGTYQLPKLSCHTCKKKFHSACLYKWFSTSNKSTCPICRNLF
ncbi:hypothetical protein RI129_000855 [Pyrocoelia pectoralis]|uniref:E3 ubiquitin-protein ligase listerin n=1 Tax=Pyrocoelia pectoralis TaxID=417401 RepID=A0AAN7VSB9_9COLE